MFWITQVKIVEVFGVYLFAVKAGTFWMAVSANLVLGAAAVYWASRPAPKPHPAAWRLAGEQRKYRRGRWF